jgi:hypothetical protein
VVDDDADSSEGGGCRRKTTLAECVRVLSAAEVHSGAFERWVAGEVSSRAGPG